MAEEKDIEMKDAEAVEKDKKVPDKKKQKKGEVEKDSDLSEEDLELKNNLLMMVERISKENDPAIQVASVPTSCRKKKMAKEILHAWCLDFGRLCTLTAAPVAM